MAPPDDDAPAALPPGDEAQVGVTPQELIAAALKRTKKNKPRGRPWVKGQSGGGPRFGIEKPATPGPGRPPDPPLKKAVKEILADEAPDLVKNALLWTKTRKVTMAQVKAYELLLGLAGHVVPKKVELTGKDGGAVQTADTTAKAMTTEALRERKAELERMMAAAAAQAADLPTQAVTGGDDPGAGENG